MERFWKRHVRRLLTHSPVSWVSVVGFLIAVFILASPDSAQIRFSRVTGQEGSPHSSIPAPDPTECAQQEDAACRTYLPWIVAPDEEAPTPQVTVTPPPTPTSTPMPGPTEAALRIPLVQGETTWAYLDDGSDQGDEWRQPQFDDRAWGTGEAELGYGDDDEATVVNAGGDPNNKHITTYFRRAFHVDDPEEYALLDLRIARDDGAVVYLNDKEIFRTNLPSGEITYNTLALLAVSGDAESWRYHRTLDADLLRTGRNVLAVEVHQAALDSSDLSFALALDGIPAVSGAVRFAVIGDFGTGSQDAGEVADLVKSWSPHYVLTVGDNNYPNGLASTIDANVGQFYSQFIFPYDGDFGEGASVNRFFPTLGNHDWDCTALVGTVNYCGFLPQPYLDYFTLPNNERYYHFAGGPVHFFALSSDPLEPDLNFVDETINAAGSTQGRWLHSRLMRAPEPWKVVYFHHPPYSSGEHGSAFWMRWDFQGWGASTVFAGHEHTYERLEVDGIPYLINGLGGGERCPCTPPAQRLDSSQVCYDQDLGAMLVEANRCTMIMRFITRQAAVIDTLTLTKGCGP